MKPVHALAAALLLAACDPTTPGCQDECEALGFVRSTTCATGCMCGSEDSPDDLCKMTIPPGETPIMWSDPGTEDER